MNMWSLSPAFTPPVSLPNIAPQQRRSQCSRTPPFAKKGSSGKKRSKVSRPKRTPSNSQSKPSASPTSRQKKFSPLDAPPEQFPGPLAPEILGESVEAVDEIPVNDNIKSAADVEISLASDVPTATDVALPQVDEGKLRLPDIGSMGSGRAIRRKRKPRALEDVKEERSIEVEEARKALPTNTIRELTQAYRKKGKEAQVLIDELEKDPDFMFQTGNPEGEYDLTSAIIGTGSPNKQGVYVLPYLQSGHLLLLLVTLLCTFVYYPGFPLTELEDSLRGYLKVGLAITYTLNAGLAILAFKDAQKRGQPAAFWALKTAFFGNIAFNELRRNAPLSPKSGK
ncbi:unnamed protein product [Chondrus crispus]|uniref:Uncharacterized protein n=1 Tax=Chondrus crispus TaxID=2769 RepID=R7QAY5_CHOCR|nr:unnamed protein product [Chondrus crispus]CDF34938.1 unnamed protein product [Chondrus crispus]|eukprot:XP_005714757.1 unnamed protein product [Chondrus crispus]